MKRVRVLGRKKRILQELGATKNVFMVVELKETSHGGKRERVGVMLEAGGKAFTDSHA
jgi:hypothetical protein